MTFKTWFPRFLLGQALMTVPMLIPLLAYSPTPLYHLGVFALGTLVNAGLALLGEEAKQ